MKGPVITFALILSLAFVPLSYSATVNFGTAAYLQDAQGFAQEEQFEEPVRLIVRNLNGDELGEIIDFLVDPEVGVVAYALVDTGFALELEDLRLVPVHALSVGNQQILLNMERQELVNSPLPSHDQEAEEYHRELSEYYGVAPYWEEEE
jgi:hypothetical protein